MMTIFFVCELFLCFSFFINVFCCLHSHYSLILLSGYFSSMLLLFSTLYSHVCKLVLFFFPSFSFSKTIQINIIDDEEYEKNKNFFLEIGEPQMVEMSARKGAMSSSPGPTSL